MAKAEMFRKQPLKGFMLACNAFPVTRGTADRAAIKTALDVLARNGVLGMFPEGTRLHEGETASPQRGVAFIALRSKVKVIPVGLVGTDKIFAEGRKLPAFPRVTVAYGQPIDPAAYELLPKDKRLDAMTQEIMQGIDHAIGVADEYSRSR
jgi:1-acyl-sn-glycerol-3-phosphate acyltransferase